MWLEDAMSQTVDATYDGESFRPDQVLPIAPNTRVRITVDVLSKEAEQKEPLSFLEVARSLKLEGPPDWARNIDKYLYGDPDQPRG
jgi:hypothetical protein